MDQGSEERGCRRPHPLAGVWALLTKGPASPMLSPDARIVTKEELRSRGGEQLPPDEVDAWQSRGWAFVEGSGDVLRGEGSEAFPPNLLGYGRVYVTDWDRLALSVGDVIVRAPSEWSPAQIAETLEAAGLSGVHVFGCDPRIVAAHHDPTWEPYALCAQLHDEYGFLAAEPDFRLLPRPAWRPDDPEYDSQWSWRNPKPAIGDEVAIGGVAAERAWRHTRGAGTVLAVIDGGFDADHEELVGGIHPNSGRFRVADPSTGSAYVFDRTSTESSNAFETTHGTQCAGRAAARAGNDAQGCGMAPEASLLLVAINGLSSTAIMVRAIEYCVDPRKEDASLDPKDRADAISCSLDPAFVTGGLSALLMRRVLRYAGRTHGRGGLGTFIAWSAPNSRVSVDDNPIYRSPDVAVIGMTNSQDVIPTFVGAPYQGYGKRLFCVAPGSSVWCNFPGYTYLKPDSGCSYATPLVAGLAALCAAVAPLKTARTIRGLIRKNCQCVGGVNYGPLRHHPDYGHGRIHAERTVEAAAGFLAFRFHGPLRQLPDTESGQSASES